MKKMISILALFLLAATLSFGVYVNVGQNLSINKTVTYVPLPPLKNLTNQTLCLSCRNITIPVVILNNSDIAACDPSLVATPDYTEYSAGWDSVEEPYYLDPLTDDCSIFGFEPNITQDLDQKLALLDAMEAEVNSSEALAAQLFSQGNASLERIAIATYQDDPDDLLAQPSEPSYPSISSRYHSVEMAYPAAPFGRAAVQEVHNFHYAYEYAINAKNDTRALKDTLQSLVHALDDLAGQGKCMFGGGKQYYASLLRMRYVDTLRYVNETRGIIHHARDFADGYNVSKAYVDRSECIGSVIRDYEVPSEMANVSINQNNATLPSVITKKYPNISLITSITSEKSDRPSYIVQARLPKKLLGLIPVEMDVKSEIDAESGEIIKEEKPWWSFLLFD